MWAAGLMLALFVAAIVVSAAVGAVHPPSHIETIDPLAVRTETDFSRPRVEQDGDGSITVVSVTEMFRILPSVIRVPAGKPVKFRVTSPDVIHGFQIVGTNANVMVIPGYVTEVVTTFRRPGEYLIVCNEYCGLSHHLMQAKLLVEPAAP